ncbi:MAG: hypothetical protein PHW83_04730 [Bacteroidales bacterium]|nr:hypothetical protein [Bacteroidales bacterium]
MKKIVLLSITVLCITGLFAQNSSFNIDLNGGTRLLGMKNARSNYDCAMADLSANLGVTYMFCNLTDEDLLHSIGIRLDYGFDQITSFIPGTETETKTSLMRGTGQIVVNVDDLFGMELAPFGLIAHGGIGASFMSNPDSPAPRADRMIHAIAGISPRYWINETVAINMDFSFVGLDRQNWGVEMLSRFGSPTIGKYVNMSLGVTIGIGQGSSESKY